MERVWREMEERRHHPSGDCMGMEQVDSKIDISNTEDDIYRVEHQIQATKVPLSCESWPRFFLDSIHNTGPTRRG